MYSGYSMGRCLVRCLHIPADSSSISLDAQKFDRGRAQFIWRNIRGNVEYHNSHFSQVRFPGYLARRNLIFFHRTRTMKNHCPGISASSSGDSEQNALLPNQTPPGSRNPSHKLKQPSGVSRRSARGDFKQYHGDSFTWTMIVRSNCT